jgi:tetratricopeptide (TPR) repeat protein
VTDPEQPWDEVVSDLVEILAQLGERDDAARILAMCRDSAHRLCWLLGGSAELRCRALLRAAAGDLPEALELLDAAVRCLDSGRGSTWLGRTLLFRGGALLLQRRDAEAVSDLERALALLTRHGPPSWRAAAQRALASAAEVRAPRREGASPEEVVAVLTAGHWDGHQIVSGLRRSLESVERELAMVWRHVDAEPDDAPAARWGLGA